MLGRFIQADTITPNQYNSQDHNRYSYVRNNPLKYNDPTGHWPSIGGALKAVANAAVSTVTAPATKLVSAATATANFVSENKKAIAITVAVVAIGVVTGGAAVAVLGPGLGAAMAAGGVSGAASSAVGQYLSTGSISLKKLAVDTAIGVASGGIGGKVASLGGTTRLRSAVSRRYQWRNARTRINGGPAAHRANPAFPKGREYRELSHWLIPKRANVPNIIKNSRWNIKPLWGTDHALADPFRYRFMPRWWKAQNPAPNAVTQFWIRTPNYARGLALAGAVGAVGYGGKTYY